MSTDTAERVDGTVHREETRRSRRGAHRFHRALGGSLAALLVAGAGLAVVGAIQGPRIRSVDLNPAALVERAGQSIVVTTDQPLSAASAEGVALVPDVPISAEVTEGRLEITVREALNYGTDYRLVLPSLQSRDTGNTADAAHVFVTPDPLVYTLQRELRLDEEGRKVDDVILRQTLSGSAPPEPAYSAPFIQEYAALPTTLAVVELAEDGSTPVVLADPSTGDRYSIPLPGEGTARQLYSSGPSELLGFTFTGDVGDSFHQDVLVVYDINDGSGLPRMVTGLDGEPLEVMDWMFVDGTTTAVAQTVDQSLYLVDAVAAAVTAPLGRHTEMRGLVPGTLQLVVLDPDGYSLLDLSEGDVRTLDLPEPDPATGAYPSEKHLLGEDLSYVLTFATPIPGEDGRFESLAAVVDAEGTEVVYEPALAGTLIRDVCVAPNGRYLAIEIASPEAELDGYPVIAGYDRMTTVFVNLDTGATVRTAYGFLPSWCR